MGAGSGKPPQVETEIKLPVADVRRAAAQPEAIGARLAHPRELEDNLVFDFPDRSLRKRRALARVRILDRSVLLTYKGPDLSGPPTGGMKRRTETEVTVPRADADNLIGILQGLGLEQAWRYQKYRTTWTWDAAKIMLDETPIGAWFEIEGEPEVIDRAATALGYGKSDYLAVTYRDLYEQYLHRAGHGSGPDQEPNRMIFSR
jgi:predicted adenylyl cyclase CyaB